MHDKVEVIKPLNGGVISDVDMIRAPDFGIHLQQALLQRRPKRNKLLICMPSESPRGKSERPSCSARSWASPMPASMRNQGRSHRSGSQHLQPFGNMVVDIGKGKGSIIFNEPSVVSAIMRAADRGAGLDAHQMVGKSHKKISVVKPLKNGVITTWRR